MPKFNPKEVRTALLEALETIAILGSDPEVVREVVFEFASSSKDGPGPLEVAVENIRRAFPNS